MGRPRESKVRGRMFVHSENSEDFRSVFSWEVSYWLDDHEEDDDDTSVFADFTISDGNKCATLDFGFFGREELGEQLKRIDAIKAQLEVMQEAMLDSVRVKS